jgi:hypothetical protein
MSLQLIPLDTSPNQNFKVTLAVDGNSLTLQLTIRFNSMAGYWVMTIQDASGNLLLDSIPMLTGEFPAANILGQFGYLRIGSAYIISNGAAIDYPDATTLGTDFLLIWGDTA